MINLIRFLVIALMGFAIFAAPQAQAHSRVAPLIGARGGMTNAASAWRDVNSVIGPLNAQRIFYTSLPRSIESNCTSLPARVTCIISYKTQDTNVTSFVRSIPSARNVIMIFHHEPEGNDFQNAATFVGDFDAQSQVIRSVGRSNVKVAMAAGGYQYQSPNRNGWDCSYIPPASHTDYYFLDIYAPRGTPLSKDTGFARWRQCTWPKGKPRGITERGVGPTSCIPTQNRAQVIREDISYLRRSLPRLFLFEYWWVDDSGITNDKCRNWKFTSQAAIDAFKTAY